MPSYLLLPRMGQSIDSVEDSSKWTTWGETANGPKLVSSLPEIVTIGEGEKAAYHGHRTEEEGEFDPWRTEQRGTRESSPVRCLLLDRACAI